MVMTLMSNPKGAVGTVVVAADGTGDTTDIQTGIDLLPAAGGCVYIKEGTYNLTDEITIPNDNIALIGCGRSTHIIQTTANHIINSTGYNYTHIEKLFLDGDTSTALSGVYFTNTTGSRVINCWIEDCSQRGVYATTTAIQCLISENRISGMGAEGITLNGSTNTIVSGNFIIDCSSLAGIYLVNASTENLVNNNCILNCESADGIRILRSDSNIVDGNICYHNGWRGIALFGAQENIISNNACSNNSTTTPNNDSGIRLGVSGGVNCLRNVISDNKCTNYGADTDQKYGIEEADANQDYNTITGNVCYNNQTGQIFINGVHTVHGRNIPPETHYWSCNGSGFHVRTDGLSFSYRDGKLKTSTDNSACYAPVSLPNGSIVTGAIVSGSISDETWTLNRIVLSDATVSSLASANINTEDTSISNATIDNSTYGYYFETSTLDDTDEIYGARITYTFIGDPS